MSRQNGVGVPMRSISSVDPIDTVDQALQVALDRSASGSPIETLLRDLGDARDEIAAAVATAALLRGASLPALPDARRLALRDELVRLETETVAAHPGTSRQAQPMRGAAVVGMAVIVLAGLAMLWNQAATKPLGESTRIGGNPEGGQSIAAADLGRAQSTAVVRRVVPRPNLGPVASAGDVPAVRPRAPIAESGSDRRQARDSIHSTAAVANPRPAIVMVHDPTAPLTATSTATPASPPDSQRGHADRRRGDPKPSSTLERPPGTNTPVVSISPTTGVTPGTAMTPTATITPPLGTTGIAGRVTDLPGAGLEAALVKAESLDGAGLAVWVRSAADGTYRLDVPAGTYRVGAEIEGYATRWFAGRERPEDADPVVVVADRRTEGVDFALPPAAVP